MGAVRSRGIGGSEIGAILGLNRWKSPIDVYMQKIGLIDGPEDNEAMYWGREIEPILRRRYERESDNTVTIPDPELLPFQGPYQWFLWSPDGLIGNVYTMPEAETEGIWEGKTAGQRDPDYWGDAGTDQVPPEYLAQVQWYMGASGAKWADLSVLFMGRRREFVTYRINFDQELFDHMVERAREFWENHITPQIPPPVDASPGWKEFFKIKYPVETEEPIEADHETIIYLSSLKMAIEHYKHWETEKTACENYLKSRIGNHSGIISHLGKISWKKNKDSKKTDWEGIARQLGVTEQMIKNFTKTIPGARVFRTNWKESK